MKCLNCKRSATYRVENTSSDSQVFCRLHIPSFLSLKKDLGNRLTVLQADGSAISQEVITEKTVDAFVSPPVVDTTDAPAKKKKKEIKETTVVAETSVVEETPVVEEVAAVVEPDTKITDTL